MAYYRGGQGTSYSPMYLGGFRYFPPIIKTLLVANALIWFIVNFFLERFTLGGVQVGGAGGILTEYFALWPIGENFWPWQLFTYMFMHGGFLHLLFNMLGLWMFGLELENQWGSKKFLLFYLLCGLGGGLANLFIAPLLGQSAPTVGASGAVFGVLLAFGMMFPDRPIYLYFLLPIRAKYFITFFVMMELFYGVTGTPDGVAHFAHLGGAAVGLLFMLIETENIPVGAWWRLMRGTPTSPPPVRGRVYRREEKVYDAKFYDIKSGRPLGDEEATQEVIDAILDKISKGGYQSLTEDEKRLLFEASKKIH